MADLKPGDPHYQAYVGPPEQYDFMGATQFRLLCTLGLRAEHRVLDFGCGSLRAGRLIMSYLDPGHYFGIEPNAWLIEDAVARQLGAEFIRIKAPRFDHNDRFDTAVFDCDFDFIVAQSIFSHTGPSLVRTGLHSFARSLAPAGIIAATFIHGEEDCDAEGWFYAGQPGNRRVTYRPATILDFAREAGLHARAIPWYHPRQAWYLMSLDPARLPTGEMMRHLSGAVLFDPVFAASV
jgi:SAM-dependent methyltransferase